MSKTAESKLYPMTARGKQERQADLLREAVEATCYRTLVLFFKGNDEKTVESELAAWKAYKESL